MFILISLISDLCFFLSLSSSLVHPPCPVSSLAASASLQTRRESLVLSVGQFRPEKDHALQLRAFAAFLSLQAKVRESTRDSERLGDRDG